MESETELSTHPNQLEEDLEKTLTLKKLRLEIADLERPWWKRPSYILAALPTLLAVVALSIGFLNGFFSAQLTKLENQRHDLQAEIRQFEDTRHTLVSQNEELQRELKSKQIIVETIRKIKPNLALVAGGLQSENPEYSLGRDNPELRSDLSNRVSFVLATLEGLEGLMEDREKQPCATP